MLLLSSAFATDQEAEILVEVFEDKDTVAGAKIPVGTDLTTKPKDEWYSLLPVQNGPEPVGGELRLVLQGFQFQVCDLQK